jgi:ribonuclease J
MTSKTFVRFWAGLRTIGGTVITVQHGDAKIVFDFGASYNPASSILDGNVKPRRHALLRDNIRLGVLPPVDGLFDAAELRGLPTIRPYDSQQDAQTAVFVSHLHLDHMLGIGFIPESVPVYMTEASRDLYTRLYEIGDGVQGANRDYQAIRLNEPVRIGAIEVTALPVDHDIAGACGFHIRTPDGTLFYTGDLRFHGLHPEWTDAAVAKARELGTDVLIIEGTMLRLPDNDGTVVEVPENLAPSREQPAGWPFEAELAGQVAEQLKKTDGLALFNLSHRHVDRVLAMVSAAEQAGRTAVMEPETAFLLLALTDCRGFLVYESEGTRLLLASGEAPRWLLQVAEQSSFVSSNTINQEPSRYLLQNSYANVLELFDLAASGGIYIHSDGVPLGAFDPAYGKLLAFLERLGVPFVSIRCGGHAPAQHLMHVVDEIDPPTLVPLHSFHPELLKPKSGVQLLPEYGRIYRLEQGCLV